jgi:lymphocyte antigen 6 complex locus protein D/E/F/G6/H
MYFLVTNALECYVCEQQEGNDDKCVKTVRMCQRHEDTCATLILWTTPHEW